MSIHEEIEALLVEHQEHSACLVAYATHASPLYVLEARYTLFHVHRLLQNKTDPALEQALENFLKKRWKRLSNTDAQYFHDIPNPANHMCIALAKALGRQQKKPHLLFLIPPLSRVRASNYVASSYDDDTVDFRQLLLSDDGMRLFFVPEILEFAEQDGVLKHSALVGRNEQCLSTTEEMRLLARHPSVENYYHAIRDKLNFQLHGETAGAYIARLIVGLRAGGAGGSGSEYMTGHEANVAITEFSFFLESLSAETRKTIFEASLFDRFTDEMPETVTMEQAWCLLEDPLQEEGSGEQHIRYCVEMIADRLEEILDANDELYQVMPFEQEEISTLESFKTVARERKLQMMNSLNTAEAHRYYGTAGDDKLKLSVLKKVSKDTAFHVERAELLFIAQLYSDSSSNSVLRDYCKPILKQNRAYLATKQMQKALKSLSEHVQHEINRLLVQPLNSHRFYANIDALPAPTSHKRSGKEEPEGSPKKKMNHARFDVKSSAGMMPPFR